MENTFWRRLKTQYAVRLFRRVTDLRRYYATPNEQVSMTDVWEDLASSKFEETDEFKTHIKIYLGDEEHNAKAAIISFASRTTLIVSQGFWNLAQKKAILQNFLLAHEYMHIALDHHAQGAVVKNFKLDSSNGVNTNTPPNWEEFETNIAATFFQCGIALFESDKSAYELAIKFRTDWYYVEKLQRLCQSQAFQHEYDKQTAQRSRRVVL